MLLEQLKLKITNGGLGQASFVLVLLNSTICKKNKGSNFCLICDKFSSHCVNSSKLGLQSSKSWNGKVSVANVSLSFPVENNQNCSNIGYMV